MNDGLIPTRYAKALFKYATEKGCTQEVYGEAKRLSNSFAAVDNLQKTIDNPYLPVADKEKVLLTASGSEKGGVLDRFMMMVIGNNREDYMRNIVLAYEKIYRQANDIAQVEITTAAELSDTELDKIKNLVQEHEKGKTLEFYHSVDPDIIGGFIVKIDSKLLDASIKNEFKKLRLKLLSK